MREIKFRAWDSEQHKMLYDGNYWLPSSVEKSHGIVANQKTCYPIKVTNHGIVSSRQLGNSYIWVEVHDDTGKPKSRSYYDEWESDSWTCGFPTMQYTGLKDKNAKEIYESDLIRTPTGIGEVSWINGCWYLVWIDTKGDTTLHDCYIQHLEVIGNIYENPELLVHAQQGEQ